jgi:hypothetical protein
MFVDGEIYIKRVSINLIIVRWGLLESSTHMDQECALMMAVWSVTLLLR